jgi:hypothetical protein
MGLFKKVLKSLSAISLSSMMLPGVSAAGQAYEFTPQERLTVAFMAAQGVTKFVMLNEKRGRMVAVDNANVTLSVPAITGAARGDDLAENPGSTPAGIWQLRFSPHQGAGDAAIIFKDMAGKDYAYVIHRAAPNGTRAALLDRARLDRNPDSLRVSDGCINLRPKDYDLVSTFAQSAVQIYGDHGPIPVQASFLAVLPESENLEETRKFLKNFYVGPSAY